MMSRRLAACALAAGLSAGCGVLPVDQPEPEPTIDDSAAGPLLDVFRAVVVVRGSDPMAPRELLPLRLPSDAAEAPDAAEADGEGETPSIDPFERGPEITEVR